MRWERLCNGTYAQHRAEGGYVLHVDALELLATNPPLAENRDYWTPRRVCLRAFREMRREGVPGVIVAHPNGIKNKPAYLNC